MTVTAPTPCPIARGPGPTMPFISRARVDGRHHYRSQCPPVESWLDAAGRAVRGSAADRPYDDVGPLQPYAGSHCRPGRRSGGPCAFPEPLRHLRGPSGRCTRRRRRHGRAHNSPRRSGRRASRPGRRLPRLRPPTRCRRPLARCPPSWPCKSRRLLTRRACGGSSREHAQQRSGEGRERRRMRARKGLRAG